MPGRLFKVLCLLISLQTGSAQRGPCTAGDCEIACQQVTLANGLTFHCRVAGPETGVGVVLLHGFPTWSVFWNPLMKSWVRSFKPFRAVACDLRGYSPGARPDSPSDYSYSAQLEDVIGIADHFNFNKFHLVGHDHGSGLGWTVAKTHPTRLYSYTAMSIPHLDALSKLLHGPSADEEQQAMMQYVPVWAASNSATEGAAWLMQFAGFSSATDWQKALWIYNAVFGQSVAMPPVLDSATMDGYANHSCCGSGSVVATSIQAASLSPNAGAPQASAMGAVDVPVTFICGTRDYYIKCGTPDIMSNGGGQAYSSMDYTYVPVDCGHDLAVDTFGPGEACPTRAELNKVFRAVTQTIETHGPAVPTPSPTPNTAEMPPVDLSAQYPRKEESILPDFHLYWSVNSTHLLIGIAAKTEGWVGFGIAEDTSGSMIGSDIVMAMVDQSGTVTVSDRHAVDFIQPAVDCHQDWEAVSGELQNGWTFVHLSRLLDTQDGEDRPLVETGHGERIVVAYSTVANFAVHHTRRAATSIWAFRSDNNRHDPMMALRADSSILQAEVRASPLDPLSRPWFIQTLYQSGGDFVRGYHDHLAGERCSEVPYRYCCMNPRNASSNRRLQAGSTCQMCGSDDVLPDIVAGYACCRDQSCQSTIETQEASANEEGCRAAGGVYYHPYTCQDIQDSLQAQECPAWVQSFYGLCCGDGGDGSHYLSSCPACMDGVPIPAARDSYIDICFSVNDLFPNINAAHGEEWHIVGFEGIIDSIPPHDTSGNVHHMTLDAFSDDSCSESLFRGEGAAPTIYAWVKGTESFAMPDEAGFTMSAPYTSAPPEVNHLRIMSVALNLHYDNRYLDRNHALDNSGIRIFVSRTKRRYNAGVLQMADPTVALNGVDVPGGAGGLGKLESTCPGACTNYFQEPITAFYHFQHMHGHGIAMYNDFFRGGSRYSTAGAIDWYDYTFEHASTERVTIRPGDEIKTTCYFDRRQRREGNVGFGAAPPGGVRFGLEASDEMCISWLNYYPEQTQSVCGIGSECHQLMSTQMYSLDAVTPDDMSTCRTWPSSSSCNPQGPDGGNPPASYAVGVSSGTWKAVYLAIGVGALALP